MPRPKDIQAIASNIVTGFCVGRAQCFGFNENEWLETAIAEALMAERERCAKADAPVVIGERS